MALYAIGDVQGCFEPLQRLLAKLSFDATRDQIWFTGDLVNRGPNSIEVLRFVANLGDNVISVLGNHDLHLLAVAAGAAPIKRGDTINDVLAAPDRNELLTWLSHRPLLHHDQALACTLVHAGLLPDWDLQTAVACAREVEIEIRAARAGNFYPRMYGNALDRWEPGLTGPDRWRLIINVFTRLRFCTSDGRIDYTHKGAPGSQPASLIPWFQHPQRRTRANRIVFGHWSALGRYEADGVVGLDSGCVWGNKLTAVRLDGSAELVSVHCR